MTVVLISAGEKIVQNDARASPACTLAWARLNTSGSGTFLRMYSTRKAGSTPIQNRLRHAHSGGNNENATVYKTAAAPHPTAQPLCTVPTALPRCSARTISPINTEPTAHSPPKPRPCNARSTNNCSKFCAKPMATVHAENHRIVYCRTRTRP
ncbi:hypothetical protein D3C73_620390 [compost metagenome]